MLGNYSAWTLLTLSIACESKCRGECEQSACILVTEDD